MTFAQTYHSDAILSILRSINERVEEMLQNRAFAHLVTVLKAEGNIVEQKISHKTILNNPQLMEYFHKNKKLLYAVVIF